MGRSPSLSIPPAAGERAAEGVCYAIPEPVPAQSVSGDHASTKSAITGIDEAIVKELYEELLALQEETNFYPSFVAV